MLPPFENNDEKVIMPKTAIVLTHLVLTFKCRKKYAAGQTVAVAAIITETLPTHSQCDVVGYAESAVMNSRQHCDCVSHLCRERR